MEPVVPVLLDTDIGSDIDDALCLAYLLRQPRCKLVGITTVTGQAQRRAMLADALCRIAGREDIPIHSGAETPLLVTQQQEYAPQADTLAQFPHRKDFPPNTAVEFMRQTIRRRPGEITLLAIGPLTNVALLFAVDPEIPRLLKGLVLMCGRFNLTVPYPSPREWNAMCDPHATAIVYRTPVSSHISIGLDVTTCCRMEAAECRIRLRGGPLDVVSAMAEVWFGQGIGHITFHDPLAGAVIFAPELCSWEDGLVEVELLSRQVPGMTHWTPSDPPAPHRIAATVDEERFFRHFFEIVGEG